MKQKEWKAIGAEFLGTALMVFGGLSFVVFDFGAGSAVARWLPEPWLRRVLTGFLFGSMGGLVALSPLGRVSGAHLNPAVTAAFFGRGLMPWRGLVGYLAAQVLGAALGTGGLLLWGHLSRSVHDGTTVPGPSVPAAFAGEAGATFCLICVILLFTSRDRLKPYTPYTMPVLYAVLVGVEAPLSGCSTNPARSFGPALWSGIWTDYWLYWLAPLVGTLAALALFTSPWLQWLRTDIAKLYHFGHDETGLLRGQR